jgi:class 3 adenylate cyclase
MEHKTLDEIRDVADILPNWLSPRPLSKSERLERWAAALEREGGRHLKTLFEIEYAPPAERAALRADDSPLTVAFNDTRLRAEGLAGDTVGDAVAFFGISDMELHDILCFCHHGATMAADAAAMRIRTAVMRRPLHVRRRLRCGVDWGRFADGLSGISGRQ